MERDVFCCACLCFQIERCVCIVLTMAIFMFSVSLLLAFHHVHLHHLCSFLHFEQCWLASWKVGELNLGSEGIGSVQLTCSTCVGKSDVFVWKNPVVAAVWTCIQCCVQSGVPVSLSVEQIVPPTDTVLLPLLKHKWPGSHLHCGCDSVAFAA